MKYLLYGLLAILILSSCSKQPAIQEYSAEVDEVFADWDAASPGASMAIIRDGQVEYAKGYGMANMEYAIPNASNTVFRIGSTSKQFTAACIVLLAEQGKLNLEDRLSKFFPFPDYANKITLRHLLNHTSGVRDYLTLAYLAGYDDDDFYTDEDVMKHLVNQQELNFSPGSEFLYSNSGYWLLGQVVKQVSGVTMAVYADEHVFKPLAMKNTHFHDNNSMIVVNRAAGYRPVDDHYEISMTQLEMIGDGGIFTTIEDIAKWVDNFTTHKVGSQEFTNTMQTRGILNSGDTINYALGLNVTSYKGMDIIRHGGAFVGFRAELVRFPTKGLAVTVLANRSDGQPSRRANQIADILFADILEADEKEVIPVQENEAYYPSAESLNTYAGSYWSDKNMEYNNIILKNDTLYTGTYALLPVAEGEFVLEVAPEIKLRFDEDSLILAFPGRAPQVYVAYVRPEYNQAYLTMLSGNYYSEELQAYYKIELTGDELVLFVNDKEISPLKSAKGDVFVNDDIGTFEFTRTNDRISGFTLAAGRVKNLKFLKK
jgi:CubicO group peptidase (beta-lactamase class C family)